MPAAEHLSRPHRFNVIGAAGNFADGDDHTDEERKMMFETRKILEDESIGDRGHLRAGPGPGRPLRGGQRPDARAAQRRPTRASCSPGAPGRAARGRCRRRCGARGATRCSSGASATTSRIPRALSMWVVSRQPAQGRGDQRGPDRGAAGRRPRRRRPLPDELYELMRCAPSTRHFTDQPVPREVLERVLDNARFAPSGGNRQGWRVIVVTDRDCAGGCASSTRSRGTPT